ncbi:MAG: threonine synthase, partial [Erysipelotrichaceae bacterium]|nr:threonine synthase [Erysipelotrichaceae bacterium]
MHKFKGYRCTLCGKSYAPDEAIYTCPSCGDKGILDVEYDYEKIKEKVTLDYFKNNRDYSMWRYAPLMSIVDDHISEMLRIGWTPLYKSKRLAGHFGLKNLYIKDEGLNPSGSTKDR